MFIELTPVEDGTPALFNVDTIYRIEPLQSSQNNSTILFFVGKTSRLEVEESIDRVKELLEQVDAWRRAVNKLAAVKR